MKFCEIHKRDATGNTKKKEELEMEKRIADFVKLKNANH